METIPLNISFSAHTSDTSARCDSSPPVLIPNNFNLRPRRNRIGSYAGFTRTEQIYKNRFINKFDVFFTLFVKITKFSVKRILEIGGLRFVKRLKSHSSFYKGLIMCHFMNSVKSTVLSRSHLNITHRVPFWNNIYYARWSCTRMFPSKVRVRLFPLRREFKVQDCSPIYYAVHNGYVAF